MPSFQISLNFTGRLRVEPTELSLDTNPLVPELIVPIHIQLGSLAHSSLDRCVMLDISATLLGGPRVAKLAIAERQPTPAALYKGHENQFGLRFPLHKRAAAELEHDRKRDMLLSFAVRPILGACERL